MSKKIACAQERWLAILSGPSVTQPPYSFCLRQLRDITIQKTRTYEIWTYVYVFFGGTRLSKSKPNCYFSRGAYIYVGRRSAVTTTYTPVTRCHVKTRWYKVYVHTGTWYRCRREQEDGRWFGNVPVCASPSRLCSRDGNICCYGDALSTIFLLAFVPCFLLFVFRFSFLFFVFLHPGMFIFSVPLRLCSSHLLLSASTVFYCKCSFCLCHLYPTPSRNSFVFFIRLFFFFFFRSSYFSGGVFFLLCSRTRYATTWFAYLDSSAFGFSVSHPHNLYLSRMNQEGHWGYCWVEKNGLMWKRLRIYCLLILVCWCEVYYRHYVLHYYLRRSYRI